MATAFVLDGKINFNANEVLQGLKRVDEQVKNTDKNMSNLGNNTNGASKFSSILSTISNKVQQFGEKMTKIGSKLSETGSTLNKKLTVPIVGLGTACTVASMNFEDAMAKFGSIMDTSQVSVSDMKNRVLELSNATGISASEIAEAGYTAISSGASTSNALELVESSARLAKTGFTDLGTAMDVSTTVMNAYKMKAEDLGKISDVLNITQDRGKTTVGELGNSMGNVIPVASSYNVSLEQLSGAYATLTKNGIKTDEAGTAIKGMLTELGKSGTKVSDILKEKTGKSFAELMKSGYTLTDVLEIVKKSANENGLALGDMFSNVRATLGANSLTQNSKDFADALQAMGTQGGITDDKLSKLGTTNKNIKKTFNELKNVMISFGDQIAPSLSLVVDKVKGIVEWFGKLDDGTKNTIVKVLALVAGIAPLLKIFGTMASSIGTIINLYKLFQNSLLATRLGVMGLTVAEKAKIVVDKAGAIAQGALNAIMSMNPITLIIIAITALIAILVVLYNKCEPFRNFINSLWQTIKSVFSQIATFIKGVFDKCVNIVKTAINVIKVIIMTIVEVVKLIINLITMPWRFLWENCKQYVFSAFNAIKQFILAYLNWWKSNWEVFKQVIFTVWNSIKDFISTIWEGIKTIINTVVEFIKNNIITPLTQFFSAVWEGIKAIISSIWDAINNKIQQVVAVIKAIWETIKIPFEAVANFLKITWDNVVNGIKSVWDGIVSGVVSAWNTIKAPFESVVNGIKSVWNGLKSVFKMPHVSIEGSFSLNPPSVPKPRIEWYANGGIMTQPTLFGMNGSSAMVGGEAGAEAILPLSALWSNLDKFLDKKLNKNNNEGQVFIIRNELDGKVIGEETYKIVNNKLALASKRR